MTRILQAGWMCALLGTLAFWATALPSLTISLFDKMTDGEVVKYLVLMKDLDTAALFEAMAKKGEAQTRRVGLLTQRLKETLVRNAPKP